MQYYEKEIDKALSSVNGSDGNNKLVTIYENNSNQLFSPNKNQQVNELIKKAERLKEQFPTTVLDSGLDNFIKIAKIVADFEKEKGLLLEIENALMNQDSKKTEKPRMEMSLGME